MKEFEGKTAIITGAGQGMGKAIAKALFANGANVVISDINAQSAASVEEELASLSQLDHELPGRAISVTADVRNKAQVEGMALTATEAFGSIDILINTAGVLKPTGIEDISEEEWDFVMDINAKGVFLCTQAVLGVMRAHGYGRIVNMSSSAGRSTSTLGGAHYTASKAAVLGFTRHCAREYAGYGITCNAVCPGLIDTEMVEKEVTPERLQKYLDSFPIHRLGTPEEVAELVLFLSSDRSAYITGASIDINGGDLML
jgi:NAD(P)-dependent dehydrogenase (short-subunit alcohol dehydrogenase family)